MPGTNNNLQRHVDSSRGNARVDVHELADLLGVTIAWRPWPRWWLTNRERRLIIQALADSDCELTDDSRLPSALLSYVTVTRIPLDATRRGTRLMRVTRFTIVKLIGLIGLVAGIITIWPVLFPSNKDPAPLMGDMNFAVIPFQTAQGRDPDQLAAKALSQTLVASLKEALRRADPKMFPDVRVVSDASVSNAARATQSQAAAVLAARIGADAVIFGTVEETLASTTVTPWVYVAPPKLLGAREFAGTYPLGDPIRLPVSLGSSAPATSVVRQVLTNRAAGLARFIDAIGYSSLERFTDAVRYLMAAAKSPGWRSPLAQGLLDLFLANATAKLPIATRPRLSRAEAFYRAALIQMPGFARARLGLAEITFQRAHGDCTKHGADAHGLNRALAQYQSVLDASSQPVAPFEKSVLQVKMRFGEGRVYLCQSQAELAARWATAKRELLLVTSAYPHDALLRDDAAEAFGDLAIVELPRPGQRDARHAYLQAQASYSRAIALTGDPTALPALYANSGFVASQLGQRASATADYQMAARLKTDPRHVSTTR